MLPQDYDLKASEVQQLSSSDALVGFFTALGYDTSLRLKQMPEALGLPESLARQVISIDRVADQEQGALQVYIFEMKHVTVALTQSLARVFKTRAGLFLLVLTTLDYEQLDFVLMDPVEPVTTRSAGSINAPQAVLHPRILSVLRRNPDRVSLRVLRRFSFTEIDVDYQWDKLRSAYGVAEWSEPFFNNRALFSDYYLNQRLPGLPEWQEEIRSAYQAAQALYSDVRQQYAGQTEQALRKSLFEKIFQLLGWSWKEGKPPEDETAKPDYHLIAPDGREIPCLTYVWDRFLDGPDETRDTLTPHENPGQIAVGVLDSLNADGWVIMTSGKIWRLYAARAHSRATNYYEIDLEETLASSEAGIAFRYFWLLFRAAAYTHVEGQPCFADRLLDESANYAKALGERLKERVFEHVFPHFAEGFIHHWRKTDGRGNFSDEELGQVFQATLTFLYRLLFLLYAEARDLLPIRETRGYYEVSLQRIKEGIAQKAASVVDEAEKRLAKNYDTDSTALYGQLLHLCRIVDRGQPDLNVPVYNGGLFITFDGKPPALTEDDPPEFHNAVFLSLHKIPDRFLAQGLDLLARDVDEKTFALAMIDYKSLGVRQLGSIYEGLLEFKVRIAEAKMAIVAGKKGEEIYPYSQAIKQALKIKTSGRGSARTEMVIPKGKVYLTNDRRERKATGSYYTPDYIVKYIVQHAVGPALETKCEVARPLIRESQKSYQRAVDRRKAFQRQGMQGDDPEKTAQTYQSVVDALFDLRVLDPAMGSGHFLVEAVDFITDKLLTYLTAFPWNPVIAALRQTRHTILEEMQRQGVNVDPARLTDVHLLKRHVLKRCIYGVDLNPMAVELAKVSLWLDCFTLGAPLSFLDHHLKCGNSLIGARIEEVRAALDMAAEKDRLEIPLLAGLMGSQFAGVMLATDLMRRVGELSDVTAGQVRESQAQYRQANDALAPYKRILDVYTSRWFGNPDTKLSQPVLQFLRDNRHISWLKDPINARERFGLQDRKVSDSALKAAHENQFFHWELEFPEVFFGPSIASPQQILIKENPGFDTIVGNPPYERTKLLVDLAKYLEQSYQTAYGAYDIYVLFIERALSVLKKEGYLGQILSNKFLVADYGEKLREKLYYEHKIREIIDLTECPGIFEGAMISPVICVIQRGHSEENDTLVVVFQKNDLSLLMKIKKGFGLTAGSKYDGFITDLRNQKDLRDNLTGHFTIYIIGEIKNIFDKLYNQSDILSQIAELRTGIMGFNYWSLEPIIKDSVLVSQDELRLLPPSLVMPYSILWGFESVDLYKKNYSNPVIRMDTDLIDINTQRFFRKSKIVVRGVARKLSACIDTIGHALLVAVHGVIPHDYDMKFLTSLLNSKLFNWIHIHRYYSARIPEGSLRYPISFFEVLPIRRISFSTLSERRVTLSLQAQSLYFQTADNKLLTFTEERLATDPEESDVVYDLLVHLAEQMINLNEQKQVEMKRFLELLEVSLHIQQGRDGGTALDALTGKSQLRNYLGDYQKGEEELPFDELQDVLFKNRTRLGVSLNDVRFMAKLREEYEKSLAVLLPIKEKLKRTDELIDQIVYRLYGLTEEEIAVVEGKR